MPVREKICINVENPFILNETGRLWMVLSGEVNLFFTQIGDDGSYLVPLKHLYTVQKGEIVFSFLTENNTGSNIRLIAFSNNAKLLPVNKDSLLDMDHFFLKNMISQWISSTAAVLCTANSPRVYKALDHYRVVSLEKDSLAFPSGGISWVHILKGEASVYAESTDISQDKLPGFLVPVSNKLWIKSLSDDTELKVISTREVLQDDIYFLLSLAKLEEYFHRRLAVAIDTRKSEEIRHFQEKRIAEEQNIQSTLQKIRSLVAGNNDRKGPGIPWTPDKKNILFSTCRLIGEQSGFRIDEPRHIESYENSITNQLYAIAKSSKIRIRKIILRGTWWKEENGHLLAFTKKDKTPVALLQSTSAKYILKDLSTGRETTVNNEIAETLEPIGYMFFSGFDGKMTSVKKVAGFALKGVKKDAKILMAAALAGSLIGLLVPVLSGIMYDDVIPAADRSLHKEIFIIMVMIGVITAGLQLVKGVLQQRVEAKSSISLQAGVMDHMLRLPVTFYKKFSAGDLTNRVLSINMIRQIVSNTLMTAVLSGAFSSVNLILLFYYNSQLAWIGIGLALIAMLFMVVIGLLKLKYDREVSKHQGEIQGFLFEFLSGISKIRITGGERRVFTLWADKFSRLKKLGFASGSYQNFVETFNASYPLVTSIFFFAFLYYTVLNSDVRTVMLTVGAFMAFIIAFNQFLNDSLRLSMAIITSLNVITLYERVKPILEEETESVEQSVDPGELAGDIEMNSVSFRYHKDQPLVLNDVTFKIKSGEMVAFVGASGSGKSTIMRLLLGFEYPELGSIYFDSDSFESMNKELVRRQIGVVLQNGSLMSGSIYQNIVGNSELTLDDAWEAARMAGMEQDIRQMPMEMHTVVSEGAGTFSGGQKQRLMIARAIVHKPRLLFMDEATSALDNRTQNIVSESLDKLQATRIIIAHRLSTIKNADRIYVMDKGTIVETGTYDELMEMNGLFAQLAKRQIA